MNYLAFTRPVWCWLRDADDDAIKFLGDPAAVPRFGGAATVGLVHRVARRAAVALDRLRVQPARLARHDAVPHASCGDADRQIAGAGLLFTLPGRADGVRRRRGRRSPASTATAPASRCRGTGAVGPRRARRLPRARRAAPLVAGVAPRRAALGARRRRRARVPARGARRAAARAGRRGPTTSRSTIDAAALDGAVGERRFGDGDVVARRRHGRAAGRPAPACTSGS